ncbi:hypothetical protein [Parasynechococcus sp.]|uniref:hypothetical protein n=1 Tax=Parasynechococcus sp. TaxID=3101203 RepID=UPI0037043BB5
MTTSLQSTVWNRHCQHENRRADFLMHHDCAGEDLRAVKEALTQKIEEDETVPAGAEYAGYGCCCCRGFTIQAIEQENQ